MKSNQRSRLTLLASLACCVLTLGLISGGSPSVLLASPGPTEARSPSSLLSLDLTPFAAGFNQPVGVTHSGSGDERLFVVERAGRIRIVSPQGIVSPVPFLDITDRVDSSSSEEGLLGLAFHPDYATKGHFYVNYTSTDDQVRRTRISRFRVSSDPNVADPGSEDILLTVEQPHANHNAGDIHFGPDGYLYIPLGDGGSAGDPGDRAQDPALLLGKISRIDVDAGPGAAPDCSGLGSGHYTVPAGNPLVDGPGAPCDEIWASGLRNPWRSSFDRLTGDFWIGDVGQNSWEEIDFQPFDSTGGENYGWRCYEGNHAYNTAGCGSMAEYTFPIFEYGHPNGCASVTGGYVYRGSRYPAMVGRYLLADYCSGSFWDLALAEGVWQASEHTNLAAFGYVAFGQDAQGELYVVNGPNGTIYALAEKGPDLSITKRGPALVSGGQPISYTLAVVNGGQTAATNLVISDTIPAGATYVPGSGGSRAGDLIRWTLDSLQPLGTVQVGFAVTATQSITNTDYRVSADGGRLAVGTTPVTTRMVATRVYLPLAVRARE